MSLCGQRFASALSVLAMLLGWAMSIVALSQMFPSADPAEDFRTLATPCVIVGVYYDGPEDSSSHNHATKKTDYNCYDVYTYEFAWCEDGTTCTPAVAPSSVGITAPRPGHTRAGAFSTAATEVEVYRDWWTSFPPPAAFANPGWEATLLLSTEHRVRRWGGTCDSTSQRNSTLSAGTWVTCYQPTSTPVDATYSCGNAACIKLSDPALDLSPLPYELLIFGGAWSLLFMAILACFVQKNGGGSLLALMRFIVLGDDTHVKA